MESFDKFPLPTHDSSYPTVGNALHLCLVETWLASRGKAQGVFCMRNFCFLKNFLI